MICKKGLAFFCHSDEMTNLSLNNHSLYLWHFSLFENYFPDINIATSTYLSSVSSKRGFSSHYSCGGGNEDNGDILQKVPCMHCLTQCPRPCSRPPPETPGHSQASLGQSLVGSLLLSPGSWCTEAFVCALQESVSPVLCKFCGVELYGGVNVDLLQEGLCHNQVRCIKSPCPLQQATADPYLLRRHSKPCLAQFLWCHLVCARFCLSSSSISAGYGVWF